MSTPPAALGAYLERIGYAGPLVGSAEALSGLHLAHVLAIPFENLDIQLGRPILLDAASLQAKLVDARRGGYCFEHNLLFAAMLETVGFRVRRLAARVRSGRPPDAEPLPRTHMLLSVEAGGASWLSDVGFGAEGLLVPVPLDPGPPTDEYGRSFRLVFEGPLRVVQSLQGGEWRDLYAFSLEEQLLVDYEMANLWTSISPRSGFVQNLVAQRRSIDGTLSLRNRELRETTANGSTVTQIDGDEDLLAVLAERFRLALPPGTRFRCLTAVAPAE